LTNNGLITGTVTDSSGAVIPGASVNLRSAAGQSRTASAGPDGGFRFGGLAYGRYTLTVKQPGFEANTQTVSVESPAAISKTIALGSRILREDMPRHSSETSLAAISAVQS